MEPSVSHLYFHCQSTLSNKGEKQNKKATMSPQNYVPRQLNGSKKKPTFSWKYYYWMDYVPMQLIFY